MKRQLSRRLWFFSVKQWLGIAGILSWVIVYVLQPSWPTPDKLIVLFLFIFMALKDTKEGLLKFGPFVLLLLLYESLRGWAAPGNTLPGGPTHYDWPITVDTWLGFGKLPTERLQDIFWTGAPTVFDQLLYVTYMLHFVLPLSLGLLIWKLRGSQDYWQYAATILLTSFAGFITFWAMPVAPPWLAVENGVTSGFVRVSSEIWATLGLVDFPSVYNQIAPNTVAAVPSLHAAYATLISLFTFKLFGKKLGLVSLLYPVLIYFGTVYMADHYLIDEIIGSLYAFAGFGAVVLMQRVYKKRKKPASFGVSFSLLNCREYGIDWQDALSKTIDTGFRRYRVMSYWSLHEEKQGTYDFSELDKLMELLAKSGCKVTFCVGLRQPRWPETHIPDWAKKLSDKEITAQYLKYHQAVLKRYSDNPIIISWQLENEFWLRRFGENFNYDRKRLVAEFDMVRKYDSQRPIIMSLGDNVGYPLRAPRADMYATSIYRNFWDQKSGAYTHTTVPPVYLRFRGYVVRLITGKRMVVHELQAEPWGPEANWKMSRVEQEKSMDAVEVKGAIEFARKTGITYVDLWGAEWWYWYSQKYKTNDIYNYLETIHSKAV